tara:strand:+ start:309 stop:701 length:393 start_codon:yes stop_codon:yes gene_type:complete
VKARVIVETETGNIMSTGVCLEEDFNIVPDGCTAYENTGNWGDSTHKLIDGEFLEITQTDEEALADMWMVVRMRRDYLLMKSDWTQATDSPLTADQRTAWQLYRQNLRDLAEDFSHKTALEDVTFPTAPS